MATPVTLSAKEWQKFLKKVDKIKKPFPLLRSAFFTFGFADIQRHFRAESGPSGAWAGIKRAGKILQDTGRLKNSILPGNAKQSGRNGILIIASTKAAGANTEYAGIHNRGEGRVAKREFMWLSAIAQERILNQVMSKLV